VREPPSAASPATDAATLARATDASAPAAGASSAAASTAWTGFLGGNDDAILRRICNGAIAHVERNRGGSTLSFRTRLDANTRGLFKPQQANMVANFRAELAAYRLSRLLGLHRVPPACGRIVDRAALQSAADASGDTAFSERVMRELLGRGEQVPGAMLYWVPGPLEEVPEAERWPELLDPAHELTPEETPIAADLARLVLFDYVTNNVDRWSGGNVLRQHLRNADPGPVLFMDNGAAFSIGTDGQGSRPDEQSTRLTRIGRLPRALIAALRDLTAERVTAAMAEDPIGRLLGEQQIRALLARRDRVIAHADTLIRERGEAAVLVFP
jgi:hypothetical protein